MYSLNLRRLNAADADFSQQLDQLLQFEASHEESVQGRVKTILAAVKSRGDEALLEYTNLFDRRTLTAISEVIIDRAQLQAALARIPADQAEALQQAAERVRDYHSRQQQPSWSYQDDQGNLLGQKVTP
ncbi:MAG TPA: histidinol dehydrogenase, partial [Cellvibrionaceae bacterium]|nr:histidinol dehydrogenase [Cellvibrionaceae bacterium]